MIKSSRVFYKCDGRRSARYTLKRFAPEGICENYGCPPDKGKGVLSGGTAWRANDVPFCRYGVVDRAVSDVGSREGSNHAFHRTLRLRQRDPATGINFAGDTLPRARRGITRAVKAPGSSRSCSTYANPLAGMYLCALILRHRRARNGPPRALDRSSHPRYTIIPSTYLVAPSSN